MPQSNCHRYCVIMCGGIGSRFWPYSREFRPKQFIDFFGTGRSLLQMCYDRVLSILPQQNIFIVTNAQYADLVQHQIPDLNPKQILLEPTRRGTAPCIAWAAYHIHAIDPLASMIVTPSDNLITREMEFHKSIVNAFDFVENHDVLLTIGVQPSRPETRYGYIQIGAEEAPKIYRVKTFTEKPDMELARVFIDSGEFFWNSGIYLWRAQAIINAVRQCAPTLAAVFDKGQDVYNTPLEEEFIQRAFPACISTSIDTAIIEKCQDACVECVDFGWSDLGTWGTLFDTSPKNRDGNVANCCNLMAYNSTGNIFTVDGQKLIVVEGLKDYIVTDSGDVLLICPRSKEQSIKQMVYDARIKFGDKYL